MAKNPPAPGLDGRETKRPPRRRAGAGAPGPKVGQKRGQKGGKAAAPEEVGGPEGPEPTRYGDWEIKGRCVDF